MRTVGIAEAAGILRAGGLVAFPTETVYGLGADALSATAVEGIYRAKGRPATSPLIVHVASVDAARELVTTWPTAAQRLAERFWPGPLTLVLPKRALIPDVVSAGLATVGVRVPAHPLALELIEAARVPVAAPSANRFTELSPSRPEHVRAAFAHTGIALVDGGATPVGIESTVLSLAGDAPVLLRPGMITREEIEAITGPLREREGDGHESPGLHPKHYSPRTFLRLVTGRPEWPCVYVSHGAGADVEMPGDPFHYAAALYATLHRLDVEGHAAIAVERVPEGAAWEGVRDRLARAEGVGP